MSKDAPAAITQDNTQQLADVIPIRTETVLSQFPIHRLSKGSEPMEVRFVRANDKGKVSTVWRVSPSRDHGEPGILAYKLDTLFINRLIDELRPNIPEVIRLGSLREIAWELGYDVTANTNAVKKALYQNAGAMITAKLNYTGVDGTQRKFEFGSTRYGIIFTGETLPNGRTADAVYIVLNPIFHEVLKQSKTRPLDYEYLKLLQPAAQRLYELLSFKIFGALKRGNERASYLYSDFCKCAPLTRYDEWERVKKQLYKLHQPHRESGYITKVEFEEATDEEGRPDWLMLYTPGRKARHEFKVFTTRKPQIFPPPPPRLADPRSPETPPAAESEIVTRMRNELGISAGVGRALESAHAGRCLDWCEAKKYSKELVDKGAGYFVKAISEGWELPASYNTVKKRISTRQKEKSERIEREAREAYQELFEENYYAAFFAQVEEIKAKHAEAWCEYEDATSRERESLMSLLEDPNSRAGRSMLVYFVCGHFTKEHRHHVPTFWEWDEETNPGRFDFLSTEGRTKLRLAEAH